MPRAVLPKVTPPRLARIAERPRISALLREAAGRGPVCLAASGGSGKTTAVASFLARSAGPIAWLHLDAGDGHPASFFHFLALALRTACPRSRLQLPEYAPEMASGVELLARRFARAAVAALPNGAACVLDGTHELAEDSPVHAALAAFCEELAHPWRLFLLGRGAPHRALARAIANGRLEVVDEKTLLFDVHELRAALLARGIGRDVDVESLREASDGWIAGALLMSMQGGRFDVGLRHDGFDREALFSYFAAEAFDRLDEAERRVLLATAFAPQVTPRLARDLSGDDDAASRLEALARRNLFTERVGEREERYRYHQLFASFLKDRAAHVLGPREAAALKLRTARALLEGDAVREAIPLFLDCGAWSEASAAMAAHAEGLLCQGQQDALLEWLRRLPEPALDADPWLRFWMSQCLLYTDERAAHAMLERAHAAFTAAGERAGSLLAAASIPGLIVNQSGTYREFRAWIARIEDDIDHVEAFRSEWLELKAAAELIALCYCSETLAHHAPRLVERAFALLEPVGDANLGLHAMASVASWSRRERRFEAMAPAVREADRLMGSGATSPLAELNWDFQRVQWETHHGSVEAASALLDESDRTAAETGIAQTAYDALLLRLIVAVAGRDALRVQRLLPQLERQADPARPGTMAGVRYFRALLALLRADAASAVEEIDAALAMLDAIERPPETRAQFLGVAIAAHALGGDLDTAMRLCDRGEGAFHGDMRCVMAITRACLGAARALRAKAADATLQVGVGLSLAREHRYHALVRHAPAIVGELCAFALAHGIEPEFVKEVIRREAVPPPARGAERWPWPVRIRTRGGFEVLVDDVPLAASGKQPKTLQLLQLIVAHGATNVPIDPLIEQLWPGEGRVGQQQAFDTTLHRLRRLLGSEGAIRSGDRRISLDPAQVLVEADESPESRMSSVG